MYRMSASVSGKRAVLFCSLLALLLPTIEAGTTWPFTTTNQQGSSTVGKINHCLSYPCQNGGHCADGVDSYWCWCLSGYTGENCEQYLGSPSPGFSSTTETSRTTASGTTSPSVPAAPSPDLEVTFNGTLELPPAVEGRSIGATLADLTMVCVNSYADSFQTAFVDIIARLNANIRDGLLCASTPGLRFSSGGIIMLGGGSCSGNQIAVQFSLRLSTNLLYSMQSMEECAYLGGQYVQLFVNWRQPIIGGIYNCPAIGFSPLIFTNGGVNYVCSDNE